MKNSRLPSPPLLMLGTLSVQSLIQNQHPFNFTVMPPPTKPYKLPMQPLRQSNASFQTAINIVLMPLLRQHSVKALLVLVNKRKIGEKLAILPISHF
jgi:hypothetical protein